MIALHYQNDVLHPDGKLRFGFAPHDPRRAPVVAAASSFLAGARATGMPIIHVRIAFQPGHVGVLRNAPIFKHAAEVGACEEGSWGAEFIDELGPINGEVVVCHGRINAFFDSALEMRLRACGATRLVMAGVATHSVVEHSARHAADAGYDVIVAEDACSSASIAMHRAALANIALVGRVATVAALLGSDFA